MALQKALGHTTLAMVSRYVHYQADDLLAAWKAAPRLRLDSPQMHVCAVAQIEVDRNGCVNRWGQSCNPSKLEAASSSPTQNPPLPPSTGGVEQ